jgi:hypothetical protein
MMGPTKYVDEQDQVHILAWTLFTWSQSYDRKLQTSVEKNFNTTVSLVVF